MLNSDPKTEARLHVRAENPSVEIILLDSNFDVHAREIGTMDVVVPAGLYELQYGAGTDSKNEIISLRGGEVVDRTVGSNFSGVSPVSIDAAADRSPGGELARTIEKLRRPSAQSGTGELVIFLCKLDGAASPRNDPFGPLRLVSEDGTVLSEFDEDTVRFDAQGGRWATAFLPLPPGGYALHIEPVADGNVSGEGSTIPRRAYDQSMWIVDGWQTLIFVPQVSTGPAPQIASVHMVRIGDKWDPASRVTQAHETMLMCLRGGKGVISSQHLELLRDQRTTSPMFGIISAHSALLSEPNALGLFDAIVELLVKDWPEFPDVRALYPIGQERARYWAKRIASESNRKYEERPPPVPATRPVTWPPMVLSSYQGLLRCDAKWPDMGLVAESSFAERAAVRLLVGGLWSTWEPFDRQTETDEVLSRLTTIGPSYGSTGRFITGILRRIGKSVTMRDWHDLISGWPTPKDDPVAIRLKQFLTSMAEQTEAPDVQTFVEQLKASDISLATGLPVRLVKPVLAEVKNKVAVLAHLTG